MDTLGKRIKAARAKISREALAARIGKSGSAVRNWEYGYNVPSDGDLLLLAKETGANYEWLKTGEGSMRESGVAEISALDTDTDGKTGVVDPMQFTLILKVGGATFHLPCAVVGPATATGSVELEADDALLVQGN